MTGRDREVSGPDPRDPGGVRMTPRMWVIGTLWLVLAFVLAVVSIRKAFRWSDDQGNYQQQRANEADEGNPIRYKSDRD